MGTQLPIHKKGTQPPPPPQKSAHVYCAKTAGWIKMPLDMDVSLGSGHIVLDVDPAPTPKMGAQHPSRKSSAHVYRAQTASWIMMPFGTKVGLDRSDIVLRGDPAPPPQKGQSPQFSAHICFGQMYGWIKMPHCRELGLGQSAQATLCYMETQLPSSKRGRAPNFRSMSIVAKRLHGSRWHLAWRRASVQDILC